MVQQRWRTSLFEIIRYLARLRQSNTASIDVERKGVSGVIEKDTVGIVQCTRYGVVLLVRCCTY